jgi:restriction endonuclease S subunit
MSEPIWQRHSLGELGRWVTGSTPASADPLNVGYDVPFVTPGDIGYGGKLGNVSRTISHLGADRVRRLRANVVLLVCIGTIGKVAWTDHEVTTNQQINALEVDESLFDVRFVHWLLASPSVQAELWNKSTSTTVALLNKKTLETISVIAPPLDEQRRIVATLEDRLSRLDNALAELETAKNRIDSFLRMSLDSEFSQLDVQKAAIKSFGSVKGGKRLPKGTPWSPHPTAHPYIRSTDIKNGNVNEANLVYVPESIWPSISRYVVDEGDVLITIAGTIGQTAVVNGSLSGANLTENAAKISVPNEVLLPGFLEAYMRSPSVQSQIKGLAKATTQPKLALYRIEEIQVPVPSLSLQASVLERLRQHHEAVEALLTECKVAAEKTIVLRRAVLHAAFSGKL